MYFIAPDKRGGGGWGGGGEVSDVIFLFLHKNISFGYKKKNPTCTHNVCFQAEIRKNINTGLFFKKNKQTLFWSDVYFEQVH